MFYDFKYFTSLFQPSGLWMHWSPISMPIGNE